MEDDEYGDSDYEHNEAIPEEEEDPDEFKDDETIQKECLEAFGSKDYIMEPGVFKDLKRYFKAGGTPEQVVVLLSENYTALAQTVNLFAEWLIFTGVNPTEVQQMVEDHLKQLILKHFDPKKADTIFTDGEGTPAWLESMIQHRTWRALFYKLAEAYPDCLMLNFTIKLISDAGHQGEIGSVSTACHEIGVFSKVLQTSFNQLLEGGEEAIVKHIIEFSKMVCYGEHTFLYAQVILSLLAQEDGGSSIIRRLSQEVQKAGKNKGEGVIQITLVLSAAALYPRACQALVSMIGRQALNPADVTVLFNMYSSNDPPPIELIRMPQLLQLLIKSLFTPGAVINPDHKHKYIFLLAFATCAHETWRKGKRISMIKDEMKATTQAIEKVHAICQKEDKGGTELLAELDAIFKHIRYPVVAMGVICWVEEVVSDPAYFQRMTDTTPLHLILLDEVINCHQLMHKEVLDLLIRLFQDPFPQLDVLLQMELKKTILDRMVHLLSKGDVIPIIEFMVNCVNTQAADISLIRYFVMEVLDIISQPYSADFVQLFLPIINNEDITGSLRNEEGTDAVSQFLAHCQIDHGR